MQQQSDTSADDRNGNSANGSPREAIKDLGERLGELKEYFSYYVSAKTDAMKLSVKQAGLYALLSVVGLLTTMAVIATAAVLLVVGLGGALGALFGIGWLGNIVIGLVILAGVGLGIRAMISAWTGYWHKQTLEKYEARQRKQAVEFGRSVHDRATAPASSAGE